MKSGLKTEIIELIDIVDQTIKHMDQMIQEYPDGESKAFLEGKRTGYAILKASILDRVENCKLNRVENCKSKKEVGDIHYISYHEEATLNNKTLIKLVKVLLDERQQHYKGLNRLQDPKTAKGSIIVDLGFLDEQDRKLYLKVRKDDASMYVAVKNYDEGYC